MLILSVETSCDDTCVALLRIDEESGSIEILSNIVSSQIEVHRQYGGIVPTLASREHVKNLRPVFNQALSEAGLKADNLERKIDMLAVTRGPGLIPSLLMGTSFVKALAWKCNLPVVGVNHLEGHLYSNFLELGISENQPNFEKHLPALCLVVSGGHTQLVRVKDLHTCKLLGETVDDAAGEAFDKVARLLKLGYPGGPVIEKAARDGNKQAYDFPRPMADSDNLNFSFSGLKTAVRYRVEEASLDLENRAVVSDLAASFQAAVVDVLTKKTIKAVRGSQAETVMISGGVAANNCLRKEFKKRLGGRFEFLAPGKEFCTDNAAMTGFAGRLNWQNLSENERGKCSWSNLKADPNLSLD